MTTTAAISITANETINPDRHAPTCRTCGANTDAIRQMGGGNPVHIGQKGNGQGRVLGTVCGICANDIARQLNDTAV